MQKTAFTIILFYRFAKIKNPEAFKMKQQKIASSFNLTGRILVGKEGLNGTLEGKTVDIKKYINNLKKQPFFKKVVFKQSAGNGYAFPKLKVKVRDEIVTLGAGTFDVKKETAKVITATELDKMFDAASAKGSGGSKEDFTILDLRNDYEIEAGYFEKTVHPGLRFFRELPGKLKNIEHLKSKKVVAVCTGAIRCEKATCFLKKKGFKNIYQLKDGIHSYIQKYPGKRFKGSLFVFDNRITTEVVDTKNREVVGRCFYCTAVCEDFYNDDSIRPSKKVICCKRCIMKQGSHLRQAVTV